MAGSPTEELPKWNQYSRVIPLHQHNDSAAIKTPSSTLPLLASWTMQAAFVEARGACHFDLLNPQSWSPFPNKQSKVHALTVYFQARLSAPRPGCRCMGQEQSAARKGEQMGLKPAACPFTDSNANAYLVK